MKNLNFVLFLMLLCVSVSFAGVADDGILSEGEYYGGMITLNSESLLVIGGGV